MERPATRMYNVVMRIEIEGLLQMVEGQKQVDNSIVLQTFLYTLLL